MKNVITAIIISVSSLIAEDDFNLDLALIDRLEPPYIQFGPIKISSINSTFYFGGPIRIKILNTVFDIYKNDCNVRIGLIMVNNAIYGLYELGDSGIITRIDIKDKSFIP